ncbi:MAG TPA: DUF1854 domain-containing protein [Armatimonadota bacterium]|nr:DUF1854 domain-containing protein [Armatimonadota bacterium]
MNPKRSSPPLELSPYREEILSPERVRLRRDQFRHLRLLVDSEREFADVRVAAAYPISQRANFVGFLGERGREVALIRDPERLDPESRLLLEEELARVYFTPCITRIYRVEETFGASRWEVETDRGFTIFELADREQIRTLADGRILIQDVEGTRFEIPDPGALDPASQAVLDSET